MMKIFKYQLEITDLQTLPLLQGAKILTVQYQGYIPTLWALLNPKKPKEDRVIEVIGTGNPVEDVPRKYIATLQDHMGLVWHFFERL